MRRSLRNLLVRGYLLWVYRRGVVKHPLAALRYLAVGRELTNFTYELENVGELVDVLADALKVPRATIAAYVREVESDAELDDALRARLALRPDRVDAPLFGRRLGWYCLVRHGRPHLVVETGAHDGLGSALLLRALERNAADGAEGTLVSVDIDASSGWLVPEELKSRLERHIGDARAVLPAILAGRRVGVFIHDSLHTYEHETFELELGLDHADEPLYLVSDNAHASTALADVCRRHGLRLALFVERPRNHFYPGAALGLGIARRVQADAAAARTLAT